MKYSHYLCNPQVTVLFAGQQIPKSPFEVNVDKAQGDPTKVTAKGPGLEPLGNVANKPTYFDIYTAGLTFLTRLWDHFLKENKSWSLCVNQVLELVTWLPSLKTLWVIKTLWRPSWRTRVKASSVAHTNQCRLVLTSSTLHLEASPSLKAPSPSPSAQVLYPAPSFWACN